MVPTIHSYLPCSFCEYGRYRFFHSSVPDSFIDSTIPGGLAND